MRKKLTAFLLAAIMLFTVVACDNGKKYTVKFDSNGGSSVESVTDAKGKTIDEAPITEREGYTFVGWYNGQAKITFPYALAADVTLTAKWDAITYTITFHSNGAGEIDPIKYTADDPTINFPMPEMDDHKLGGWYNNPSFSGNIYWSLPKGSTGNKEFWAKWDQDIYVINYNNLEGYVVFRNKDNQIVSVPDSFVRTFTISSSSIFLPTAAAIAAQSESGIKAGYEFGGWFGNADFTGSAVTAIPAGSKGNKELFAKWNLIGYTISFNSMGGPAVANMPFNVESENFTLPVPPNRDYYTFDGWYTTTGFSEKVTSVPKGSIGNKTFYAKWIATSFNIIYELNGGEFADDNYPKTYTIEGKTLVSPRRDDYAFEGWFESYNEGVFGGGPIIAIAPGQTGNKTLYAKWSGVDYLINYHSNGGKMPANYPQGYKVGEEVTLVNPSRDGYDFLGWFDNEECTGAAVIEIGLGSTGNKEFWAKWELHEYSISYILNGGTGATDRTYTIETPEITLPVPTRGADTFDGWYEQADFSGDRVYVIPPHSFGDKEFYAKWTAEATYYSVTLYLNGGTGDWPDVMYGLSGQIFALPSPDPVREGYTFAGWFAEYNFITQLTDITIASRDRQIYAKWTANTYNLTYNADGGTMPGGYITKYTYDQYTVLPLPVKSGFDFGGWYESANPTPATEGKLGALQPNIVLPSGRKIIGAIGNKTLYALWLAPTTSGTIRMEAENTDMMGIAGPGFSGTAYNADRRQGKEKYEGFSGDWVVGWTHGTGMYVYWEFDMDRAVSGATLTIALGSEFGDVTFNPENVAILVNGVAIDWGSIMIDTEKSIFGKSTVTVALVAGYNVVSVEVLNNDLVGGKGVGGPLIDYIDVSANANIVFKPYFYN